MVSPVTPCFTPGTMIATSKGPRAVETLRQGDKVITRDNGVRRIAWIGRRNVTFNELAEETALRPVLIRAGSMGNGRPLRDMLVSPSHRMLVNRERAPWVEEDEALVSAEHLLDHKGIRPAKTLGVSYLHILLSSHQVILANGAWTESFHPDDQIMRGLGNRQRLELLELFPEIETMGAAERFPAARPIERPEGA